MKNIPLIGYTDRLSARAGEAIEFKLSCQTGEPVKASLHRSISADPNPQGPGIIEQDASDFFSPREISAQHQPFYAGSYGATEHSIKLQPASSIALSIIVFATLSSVEKQCLLSYAQFAILLDSKGCAVLEVADESVSTGIPLKLKSWYKISVVIERSGKVSISQLPLGRYTGQLVEKSSVVKSLVSSSSIAKGSWVIDGQVSVAARLVSAMASDHYNGKLEAPQIYLDDELFAHWDFSLQMSSSTVPAIDAPQLQLYNFPARAMTSSQWDGSEMCWRHRLDHYSAIHFHQDDIYDFNWQSDFVFEVPANMPSGIYVMRISSAGYEDALPIYICPTIGEAQQKLLVLVSSYTYSVYGNHARPDYKSDWQQRIEDWQAYPYNPAEYPEYGLSTYNNHLDGSGICHASYRRPLFNLRPGYITFGEAECSGLRHFQADSHLISWLHAKDIKYDVITDDELHRDGIAALKGYAAVTTATHPEYHTQEMLDALLEYRDSGGALHYLGGNGFYWRIAQHAENPSLLEIRRAEDGIRAWAAEPGEYYNAFDGSYGGLWRRNGRAPQSLVGVGFTAQGEFYGGPYKRTCADPAFDWVFEGIDDDLIGDFGFSGNGAAGFELDNVGNGHSVPENITVLAQSVTAADNFVLVPEEQLTHLTNLSGAPVEEALRADMVYFEMPGGGRVFSTGSITFCGSLPWNNFENNVSKLLENILRRHVT
ncbi:MAG: N,N-dimethylformamidase beta subunit family domain-containing protein [Oceanospirillaceae bacterium]